MSFMDIDEDDHPHNFPSFFKIILEPRGDLYQLRIPKKFMTDHGSDLSNVVSLKIPTGKTWKVKLLKENGRAWFQYGWHEIVTYYSICHGHFLMFTYRGLSRFNVFIFDMTTSEIEYPLDRQEPKVPKKTVSETETKRSKTDFCSPSSSSKENGMLALVEHYKRKFGTLSRKDIMKINSYQFENPCFSIIMQPSYVGYLFRLSLPVKFAEEYLIKTRGSCILRNATGDTWPVRCEGNSPNYMKFRAGWKKYASDNKLRVGDICVFELKNVAKRLFQVDIIRCSRQASDAEVVAGSSSPATSAEEVIEVILIDD